MPCTTKNKAVAAKIKQLNVLQQQKLELQKKKEGIDVEIDCVIREIVSLHVSKQSNFKRDARVEITKGPHLGVTGKITSMRSNRERGEDTFWYIIPDGSSTTNEIYKKEKHLRLIL